MNFPLFIARRYLISSSKNNAINIITGIASLGIIVGALALFVVLSVFSGLREFSMSFSNDFDPDLKISATLGKSFELSPDQKTKITTLNGVQSFSEVIEERVLFTFAGKEKVAYLKGVDSLFTNVNDINKNIISGQWLTPETYQVVAGAGIANSLSMGLFDFNNRFEAYVPKPGKGAIDNPAQAFNKETLIPVGAYAINEELDSKYVFADLQLVQELLQYKTNQISAVEIKLQPKANEAEVISAITTIFNNKVTIKNRAQQNDALYKMLNTENIAVYLIFTLVIIIALFNLIGALIMTIIDKKANLKTLVNLGAEVKDLRKIFLLHGTLLTIAGGVIGLVLGIAIVLIQQRFELIMITESLAYPVVFGFKNVLIVFATILTLGVLSSIIAASRVTHKLLN